MDYEKSALYKQPATQTKSEARFSENPDDVIWVNASKTGRGATIFLNGNFYVAPITSLEKLAKGEVKGTKFVKLVRQEKTPI